MAMPNIRFELVLLGHAHLLVSYLTPTPSSTA